MWIWEKTNNNKKKIKYKKLNNNNKKVDATTSLEDDVELGPPAGWSSYWARL